FTKDNRSKALTDKTMGIGALRYDKLLNKEFETQTYTSVKLKNEYEDLCEAMRVLYVAMTRAKEKLYIVGSMYSPRETVRKLYCGRYTGFDENSVALSHCQSFMQWIMLAMLYHPEAGDFVRECGILNRSFVSTDSRISLIIADPPEEQEIEEPEQEKAVPDDALLTEIRKKASYVYPYAQLSGTALKYTASNMDKNVSLQYLAAENPAFMGAEELTPAQRGTLTHRFMEKCDFISAGNSVNQELERLINEGVFTEQEAKAINTDKIKAFFKSDMYKRISSAESFHRESEFTMSIPVSDINPTAACDLSNEKAVVQGVIDGLIINGTSGEVIDYKTDRVKTEEELIEKYKQQMRIYKTAAEECFGLENVKVTLYSFSLSKEIQINL
ncbi:MAG: PD-(D/E)XK nuclease family protein, partial [Candidatus Fimenecus sp.]